ncbi:cytidine deaminase [Ignavigranum ruoffiae]|uniref:Cytidine deaminase n=1 Tax=Ignavigranum ruoffiae TaxID=89093 RepID=A0A1H9DWX2_9LACT|nr:cytidine deaminase [Ignavigranum ruoffiae]UPQ85257.1 cytidine deaminase [Ignavigranum ruoffiae]SEQ17797.1 cytidine deaminase [Ignavigranum ruoffiae]
MNKEAQDLMEKARSVLGRAYVPYSHFPVGAALLMKDGQVITGVNVENVSFGATNCAERSALFTAISQGYPAKSVKAIAIAGISQGFLSPCSICRQVMVELCDPETAVYLSNADEEIMETTVAELVPLAFDHLDV